MTNFSKCYSGLRFLALIYGEEKLSIEPIPVASSFPNGAPDHSTSAYICIRVNSDTPYTSTKNEEILKELGWSMEQEGQFWVFENL